MTAPTAYDQHHRNNLKGPARSIDPTFLSQPLIVSASKAPEFLPGQFLGAMIVELSKAGAHIRWGINE